MSTLKLFMWFFIVSPIVYIFLLFTGKIGIIEWILGEIFLSFISFCLIYFVLGKNSKCPCCKKPFSLKKTNEDIAEQKNISVLVETKTRNKNREVTGTAEQYVPGVRTTYNVYYTCKHCGKITKRMRFEDKPTL